MSPSRPLFSTVLPFAFASMLLGNAGVACTSVTRIVESDAPASATDPSPVDEPASEEEAEDGGKDAATTKIDGGDAAPPSKPDAAPPAKPDAGPVLAGGSMTVTCPSSGFHKGPPVTIASIPSAYLPRCSSTTRTCYFASATATAGDACLDADTVPPATVGGEPVDCKQCERSQGSYCLASACTTEFTAYACCAQAQGSSACAGLLSAVTSCAGAHGKPKFDACLNALVPRCFP